MSCVEVLEDHGDHVVGESDDFVKSHVDSFFPLDDEVIEEDEEITEVKHKILTDDGNLSVSKDSVRGDSGEWGAVWYDIKTTSLDKDKTTLIVPKDGSKTYTAPETGDLRYTGEERFYVFLLAVEEDYVETIVVPESIYYASKLGSILQAGEDKKDELPDALKNVEFSSPDESERLLPMAIRGILSAKVNSDQLDVIIDYLLMNSTGDRPYKAIDVTEDIYTVGLPEGVLEMIPIVPPKISELGEINEGFVASVSAAISDYAGFVWNGICAVGEFLESVGSFVAEMGLAVLGTIWNALCAIGDAVLDALNVLVDWVVGKIKQVLKGAFDAIFGPLLKAIEKYGPAVERLFSVFTESGDNKNGNSLMSNSAISPIPVEEIIEGKRYCSDNPSSWHGFNSYNGNIFYNIFHLFSFQWNYFRFRCLYCINSNFCFH